MLIPVALFVALIFLPLADVLPGVFTSGAMDWLAAVVILFAAPKLVSGVSALGGVESILLLGLWTTVTLSRPMQGWFGGAIPAFVEFSVPALTFYFLIIALKDLRAMRRFVLAIIVTAIAICGLALSEYHRDAAEDEETDGTFVMSQVVHRADSDEPVVLKRVRATGTLADPNDLAQFLLVVSPLLLLVWQPGRPVLNLFSVILPAAIIGHTVYLTHSRGALVGLAAVAGVGLYRKLGWKGIAVALLIALAVLASGYGGSRSMSWDEESAQGRITAWSEGLQMLKHNPLFGVGFRNFTDVHSMTAHNSFVLCFAELGLIGYFFWLGLIICNFIALRQAAGDPDDATRKWAGVLILSLIAYLATAFFLSRTYAAVFYVIIAMNTALRYHRAPPRALASTPHWVVLTGCGVLLSPAGTYLIVRLATLSS